MQKAALSERSDSAAFIMIILFPNSLFRCSPESSCLQTAKPPGAPHGWGPSAHTPARSLRPIIPDNARPLRITAAAGT